jgi:hypothetical protein
MASLTLAGDFHQGANPLMEVVNVFLVFLAHEGSDGESCLVHLIHMARILHGLAKDGLDLLQNGLRNTAGTEHAAGGGRNNVRKAQFGSGGDIGHKLRSLGVHHHQDTERIPLHLAGNVADVAEGHVHLPPQYRGEDLGAPIKMNDPKIHLGRFFQHQDGQVVIAEYPRCGGPDFAGALAGVFQQVFQGLVRAVALRPDDPRIDDLVDDENQGIQVKGRLAYPR